MLTICEEIPDVEDYIEIRVAAGLSRKTVEAASKGLPNSLFSIVVYDGEQRVGLGRVIGDGGCFFEITDIAVLPSHHKQGLGARIMLTLTQWISENAPDSAYVSLMAHHGTPDFYARYGFKYTERPRSCGMYTYAQELRDFKKPDDLS